MHIQAYAVSYLRSLSVTYNRMLSNSPEICLHQHVLRDYLSPHQHLQSVELNTSCYNSIVLGKLDAKAGNYRIQATMLSNPQLQSIESERPG